MEDNKENQVKESGKRIKQQITIPFVWEERPGAPKKDWKPKRDLLPPAPAPAPAPLPVKYVASIPFKWEEKPGTPLPSFAQESTELSIQETLPENKSLPLPPAYFTRSENQSDEESSCDDYEDEDWMSDSEVLSIHSEESFSLEPSLLANGLVPKEKISSAVPLQNPFVTQQNDGFMETPSSPHCNSSPSSCVAGNTSLRGASFLEQLFPLFPPKSGFLDKAGNSEENAQLPERRPPTLVEEKKLLGHRQHSGVIRRPLTLGELIMLSRRRSCRRKAVHMKKHNPQKDFTTNKADGCFNFGASGGGIAKLLGKDLLTLKLA